MDMKLSRVAASVCVALQAFCLSPAYGETTEPTSPLFDFSASLSEPMDTLVVTTNKAVGGSLESLLGQKIPTKNGTLLLIFSPHEQAYFKDGELVRYQYTVTANVPARANPTSAIAFPGGVSQAASMRYFDKDMFGHLTERFRLELVDGRPFRVVYEPKGHTYSFYLE